MSDEIYEIEKRLLLEGIRLRCGQDFRDYAEATMKERIAKALTDEGVGSVSALQERVLRDAACMERVVAAFSRKAAGMFEDADFYSAFREHVVPMLRTYPFVRVWIAGCSSGEEVYSAAIVLKECEIYDRCRIYATDLSETSLNLARAGTFPLARMKQYARNYRSAGGASAFSEYYVKAGDRAVFNRSLAKNITFAQHSFATDASFNEFNVVFCRNVMIHFKQSLQQRALELLDSSLCSFGTLGLGRGESLKNSPWEHRYNELAAVGELYRRRV